MGEKEVTTTSLKIALLKADGSNVATWLITACAMLRRQKLWDACQNPLVEKSTQKDKDIYTDAVDLLTPLLSDRAKNRFTEEEFNDGYLMLLKIRSLFLPESDAAFIRYSRELYSLTL